jgi:excinuclease ABC subunit A
VVVEHDTQIIRAADHVVDMGPGSGEHGGHIVAQGSPAEIAQASTLTGDFLGGRRQIIRQQPPRKPDAWLSLPPVSQNNLTGFKPRFPRANLTVVTGVSGSGKSSLVMGELAPWMTDRIAGKKSGGPERLIIVNQRPIGRTPRSTPSTYCDLAGPIRTLLAATPLARTRGWSASRFSYNHRESGRCVHCEGRGAVLIEMHFLSDVWVPCEACEGLRFDHSTLEVQWKGHNIAQILRLTVADALALFAPQRALKRRLQALNDVGLGYVRLGQSATTLSGGEAQRMKLAKELQGRRKETCFLLDEPTTGLHLDDIERLLGVLHRLVDAGHMVVVIEHQLDVIQSADHIIDLGPEGGSGGGRLVAAGSPDQIAQVESSWTGRALRSR